MQEDPWGSRPSWGGSPGLSFRWETQLVCWTSPRMPTVGSGQWETVRLGSWGHTIPWVPGNTICQFGEGGSVGTLVGWA